MGGTGAWGFLGGGLAGGGIAGAMYGMSLANTIWSATHKPSEPKQTYNFDALMNQVSSEAMIPIIYGTRKWAGYQTWHNASSDKQQLTKDVLLCEGEIDGILDVRANDICIGDNVYNPFLQLANKFTPSSGRFNDFIARAMLYQWDDSHGYATGCSYSLSNGSSTQSPPDNYTTVGGYKNCAWIRANLKSSDKLQGSNPTITSIVRGIKVYDTRTGTKVYSENPSMCLRDYILSKRYGLGRWITADMLDEDSFKECADSCDGEVYYYTPTTLATYDAVQAQITNLTQQLAENPGWSQDTKDNVNDEIIALQQSLITIQSQPVSKTLEVTPRYSLNLVLADKKSHIDNLQTIMATFGGFLVFNGSKISLRMEKQEVISYAFNESNILASDGKPDVKFETTALASTPNQYIITFYDPNNNWTGVKIQVNDTADQKLRGKIIPKEVTLDGVTNQSQALRLGRIFMACNRLNTLIVTLKTGTMALHLQPGDVVSLTYKSLNAMPFRITQTTESKGIWTLKCQQYNASIYDDRLGAQITQKNYCTIPNALTSPMNSIENLKLSEYGWMNTDGTHVSNIDVTWDTVNSQFFRQYIVSYSEDGIMWKTTSTLSNTHRLSNIKPKTEYYIGIQWQNSVSRTSDKVTSSITVVGKDNPPKDIQGFKVMQQGNTLFATLIPNDEPDFLAYEIRQGIQWETSEFIGRFIESQYTFPAVRNGTSTFLVKAKDRYGNLSEHAMKSVVDVYGLAEKNVIYSNDVALDSLKTIEMSISNNALSIKLKETLNNYNLFFDIFPNNYHLLPSPSLVFPIIDLGTNVIDDKWYYTDSEGNDRIKAEEVLSDYHSFFDMFNSNYHIANPTYKTETFLGVNFDYNRSPKNNIEVMYSTSLDGIQWSPQTPLSTTSFFGRYVIITAFPKSYDEITNVNIRGAKVSIDVPDITDTVSNITLSATKTTIVFHRKFYVVPTDYSVFTTDVNGKSVTCSITNVTKTSFDIQLFDDDNNAIPGILTNATFRGY